MQNGRRKWHRERKGVREGDMERNLLPPTHVEVP